MNSTRRGAVNSTRKPARSRAASFLVLLLMSVLPLTVSAQAQPGKEAVAVFQNFLEALSNLEEDRIVGLFVPEAQFWGTSRQTLATDTEGVRSYFAALSGGQPRQNLAQALSHEVVVLADDTQLLSGLWQVVPASGAATTTLRVSMVVVQRDGEWKIAQFHNSALP